MKNKLTFLPYFFLFAFVCAVPGVYGDTINNQEQPSDSLQVFSEKLPSRLTWEKVVNVPGRILQTPFLLTFMGAAKIAEEIDETKIIPQIQYYLSVYWPEGFSVKYSARHGGGLSYSHKLSSSINPSKFNITVQGGLRDRRYIGMTFTEWKPFGDRFSSDFTIYNRLLPDESFFGIGNESKFSNENNYALNQSVAEMSLNFVLSKKVDIGARLGFDMNEIEKGRDNDLPYTTVIYTEKQLPGLTEKIQAARIQMGLTYNSLNRLKRPSAGILLKVNGGILNNIDNSDFAYKNYSADYRQFFHVKYERTFSVRFAFERTQPLSGKKIPFYYLSELGETETIRGFRRGRFRDNDMILGSIEYRYPIWREYLDAGLFVDAGQVSHDLFEHVSVNDFHYSYGGAIKVWGKESQKMQLIVGRSRDMTRFHFSWNEEF